MSNPVRAFNFLPGLSDCYSQLIVLWFLHIFLALPFSDSKQKVPMCDP